MNFSIIQKFMKIDPQHLVDVFIRLFREKIKKLMKNIVFCMIFKGECFSIISNTF